MLAEDLVYDVLEIKNALEDDHDIDELWILKKANAYRAIYILRDYQENGQIKSEWIQRLRKQKVTKVNSADDPSIDFTSIDLGKVTIPSLLSLPDDQALIRISGSSGITTFDQISFDNLMLKLTFQEPRMGEFGWCARVGNDLFLYPLVMEMQAFIIAENPLDIQVLDPITKTMRDRLITDDYPIDLALAQQIVLEIVTKDLNLNMQSISDIINDSKHQLRILQSGTNKKQAAE
jgi:hypothetical protein